MNGYKILKCFRKEKRISGELPCPTTGLIYPYVVLDNCENFGLSDLVKFSICKNRNFLMLFYGAHGMH